MEEKKELSRKHKLFCERVLITNNDTKAYMEVYPGVKEHTARVNANKLLKREDVKAYINDIRKEIYLKNVDEVGKILTELKNIYDGEKTTKKFFKCKGELVEKEVTPTISERLKAMQMYISILGYNNIFGNSYYYVRGEKFDSGTSKEENWYDY